MPNVNALDARALAAPGGAFSGLVDAVGQIVDSYAKSMATERGKRHDDAVMGLQNRRLTAQQLLEQAKLDRMAPHAMDIGTVDAPRWVSGMPIPRPGSRSTTPGRRWRRRTGRR